MKAREAVRELVKLECVLFVEWFWMHWEWICRVCAKEEEKDVPDIR